MLNYKPFDGDGREIARMPGEVHTWPGSPMQISNAAARRTIDMFVKGGSSYHSATGGTVWVLMLWCRTNNKAFSVESHYFGTRIEGYAVKLQARR